jgi:hypothetical protein
MYRLNADRRPQKNLTLPQRRLEEELVKVINLGNLESAYLFSEEGLLIAGVQGKSEVSQDLALEIFYGVHEGMDVMRRENSFGGVTEVLLVATSRRKISVRTFPAFGQQVCLVLVVPKGKTYRSHANRLVRIIKQISEETMR